LAAERAGAGFPRAHIAIESAPNHIRAEVGREGDGDNRMAVDFHNPVPRAIRPDTVTRYRDSQERGGASYAAMVTAFYDLVTDLYEFGWGQSFHFAPGKDGASFEESIASHQHFLGEAIGLKPDTKALDIGCGVGGPQRSMAREFGAAIVGLNISEYQVKKCSTYNSRAGLAHLCTVLHGDFMDIPAEDESFDTAYHIEALPHAPDKKAAYAEVFRVLRPGAIFAGYDWCVTPVYDGDNPEHRELKRRIEYGNDLPQLCSFSDITVGLQAAGFEVMEARDRASDADPHTPWYRPLEGGLNLSGWRRTAVGRRIASTALRVLGAMGVIPEGSFGAYEILNVAADSLVAAGRLGIFTPMYYHKARKPD